MMLPNLAKSVIGFIKQTSVVLSQLTDRNHVSLKTTVVHPTHYIMTGGSVVS